MIHRPSFGAANEVEGHALHACQRLQFTEDAFIERFHPVPNHLTGMAGFDFGDDGLEITDGMHVVNRIGYLVTVGCCPPSTMVSVSLDD